MSMFGLAYTGVPVTWLTNRFTFPRLSSLFLAPFVSEHAYSGKKEKRRFYYYFPFFFLEKKDSGRKSWLSSTGLILQ